MGKPSLAIHDALIVALRALGTAAGDRFFGQMQLSKVQYPYGMVWAGSAIPVDEECFDRTETSMQVDIWGDTETYFRVKEVADQIHDNFHEREESLTVAGHVIDRIRVEGVTFFPPSPNYRAMITLSIETQPAA
jgi:hypothetical protein